MALDVVGLLELMNRNNAFQRILNDPRNQFGTPEKSYLGATLLPEIDVDENAYTEWGIKYQTNVANDGTRYSPVQIKGTTITGSFKVEMGYSDVGAEFTAKEFDALLAMLRQASGSNDKFTLQAMSNLVQWARKGLALPLIEKNEKMRWECIVDAMVPRRGDGNYTEDINISNPTGQRVNAAGAWSSDSNDPFTDILGMADFLAGKGYKVNRIFCGRPVISKLCGNAKVKARAGKVSVAVGTVVGMPGRVTKAELSAMFAEDGLPPIEEYNETYNTQTSSGNFFLKRDVFVMVATTGRDQALSPKDEMNIMIPPLPNTLGYTGIGTVSGLDTPGRRIITEYFAKKPPRIEGEADQASFPVLTEPEAVGVIKSIT